MPASRVVIIGAGWYGLAAAKTYRQLFPDATVTVIDGDRTVGGVWSYDRLYPNLFAQITYPLFEYPDFPMKREGLTKEGYISGQTIHSYLHDYAEHFDILRLIKFRTWVDRITRHEDGAWALTYHDLDASEADERTILCDKLIIANGPTSTPRVPDFPHQNFTIPEIHSKSVGHTLNDIASPQVKRVTVVGAAKSAYDAVFLAMERGKTVDWIIREDGAGPIVMFPPRYLKVANIMDLACMRLTSKMSPMIMSPNDLWYYFFQKSWLGTMFTRLFWYILSVLNNWYAGYNKSENANKLRPKPDSAFWCNNGLGCMSVPGFWEMFHSGLCNVHHGKVARLQDNCVVLEDGKAIKTDFLIYCTGWNDEIPCFGEMAEEVGLPGPYIKATRLDAEADRKIEERFPLLRNAPCSAPNAEKIQKSWQHYRRLVPPESAARGDNSLVFLGQIHSISTAMVAGISTLWAVTYLEGKVPLPDLGEMKREIAEWNAWCRKRYLDAGKKFPYCIYDFLPYIDTLVGDMGLEIARKPNPWKEYMEPYGPRDYSGIYEEWTRLHGSKDAKESPPEAEPMPAPRGPRWTLYLLSFTGLLTMWAIPTYYGMVGKMVHAVFVDRVLEDGNPLLTEYTGLWPVDTALAVLVYFFYPITYAENFLVHTLLVDMVPSLMCVSIFMTIESERMAGSERGLLMRYPSLWGMFYQCVGGGVAIPLWCAYSLFHEHQKDSSRAVAGAALLPVTFSIGSLIPSLFMLYSLRPEFALDPFRKQWSAAIYQLAPVSFAVLQCLLGRFCRKPSRSPRKHIIRVTWFVFFISCISHLVALYLASEQLLQVYSPLWASFGSSRMGDLVSFFLRWDHFHIDSALLLWSYSICFPGTGFDVVLVGLGLVLYGLCGAVGVMALAFLQREYRAEAN